MLAAPLAVALLAGCAERTLEFDDADRRQMIELLMPHEVRIVEAFTGFRSFDDDRVPDGIEVLLQPVDCFGDRVKMAGSVRAELFHYLPASGNHRGDRVCEPWQIPLATPEDQRRYWNQVTGMYEIELALPAGLAPSGDKYVLAVTYTTPLGRHVTDECLLELPLALR